MKILVTGGDGFIGSFLVSQLRGAGHEVDVLTNNPNAWDNVIKADIRDRDRMLEVIPNYEIVYHLAGLLGTSELLTKAYEATQVNVIGTINVLDGALKNKTKVVEITKPNCWLNTYSITKYAGESFAKMYKEQFDLPTVSIRWYNVYGPNQSFHCQKAVPFFIKWAIHNEDIQIWGDGTQTMDLIHAHDAVNATILVSKDKSLEGTTIDVGSGIETTVNDLADMVLKGVAVSTSKVIHLPMRPGETDHTRLKADTTVLDSLGFKCEYNLSKGLDETIRWYQEMYRNTA